MPTYEYFCPQCSNSVEIFQTFSEPPLSQCPKCMSGEIHKVISGGSGVVFKGSGFYETDYKRGAGTDYKKKFDSEKNIGSGKSKGKSDKKSQSLKASVNKTNGKSH